ncbi:hypothetical protein [uncultured Senegalimassilia sp.]|uniref:Uncharacterized protein n=1 Tax=Siphoviridae sp. ctqBc4 TaxID=2827945 RepID=A0A8S5SCX7_9CAUD|nr:hypothetical protein [uncultured Senegalimassilia sp.]DAF48586.1 MAG TPA: hypothetical protein [Siphoviridae sp. ctqBc4]
MKWHLSQAKRTPKGVFVELEEGEGRGWLRLYVDPDAAELFDFSSLYELTITGGNDVGHD